MRLQAPSWCFMASPLPYNKEMPASHAPQRIACLQPSATVILASVGALDRVVACTKYCADVVPQLDVRNCLVIADSWSAQATEILAAKPDLVIAAVPYQQEAVAEILKAGIRFLGLAPRTLEDVYKDIATIAACAAAAERGAEVIAQMQAEIDTVRRKAASLPGKRVFCEEWGKPIIASQPWVAELVLAARGQFLSKPGAQCSAEDIARLDPEVIIAAWCGAGDRVPLEKIIRERGWSSTSAAKSSQVYCISDELLNTPAPTLIAGLHALAAAINPEVFVRDGNAPPGPRRITEVPPSQPIHSPLV
jgi:iron complex transport system substrate-binding protein